MNEYILFSMALSYWTRNEHILFYYLKKNDKKQKKKMYLLN